METKTKSNGVAKKQTATVNKDVKDKLTQEAIGKKPDVAADKKKPTPVSVEVSLDERIQKFEKLRGLATHRERLAQTLNELTKFNYNQDGSSSFYLRDAHGLEFKTTNTNLINLVTSQLQSTLEQRKFEIEHGIVQFEL